MGSMSWGGACQHWEDVMKRAGFSEWRRRLTVQDRPVEPG